VFPIKIPLNKKTLRKKRPSIFPKSGDPMEADVLFRALLNVSYGVPRKKPSLKVLFMESTQRDAPFLEPSIYVSRSQVYEPPQPSKFHVSLS
jgi:hypothetical protein